MAQFTTSLKSLTLGANSANPFSASAIVGKLPGVSETKNLISSVKSGHIMAADNVVWKAQQIISTVGSVVVPSSYGRSGIIAHTDGTTAKDDTPEAKGGVFKSQQFSAKGLQGDTLYQTAETSADTQKTVSGKPLEKGSFQVEKNVVHGLVLGSSPRITQALDSSISTTTPSSSPLTAMGPSEFQFTNARVGGGRSAVLGFTDPDALSPAVKQYPAGLSDPLLSQTNPVVLHKALRPEYPRVPAGNEFISLRKENQGPAAGKISSLSNIDRDTAAADPLRGEEAKTPEAITGKDARVNSKGRFSILDKAGNFKRESRISNVRRFSKRVTFGAKDNIISEEFIQQHRFFVVDTTTPGGLNVFEWDETSPPTTLAAGFSDCTAPAMEGVTTEIKEGTWEFPRLFLTGMQAGKITLSKGMTKATTGFYLWILNALRGLLTRRTLQIVSYGRVEQVPYQSVSSSGRAALGTPANDPWRLPNQLRGCSSAVWTLFNCIPTGYHAGKVWGASSGEVQIADLDVHYEWFEEAAGAIG
jgi:phage tail-like protein